MSVSLRSKSDISAWLKFHLPVSKMKMSLTIRFLPSPSLPPKMMRYCPNWVDEWQFLVEGG